MTTRSPRTKGSNVLSAEITRQIGTMSDRDLAKAAGVTEATIGIVRRKKGLPIFQTAHVRLPANSSMQVALSIWPKRIKGVGLDANILLDFIAKAGASGLTVTECRKLTSSHPLGTLIRNKLCRLSQTDPQIRYATTEAGIAYHTLLAHANLIPTRPQP